VAIKTKKQAEDIINSVLNNDDNIKPIVNESEKFEARVTRLEPNPRFVYGSLDGIQIEIFMPRYRENSVGRKVTVVRAEEIGENKFKAAQ
jgi:hypothetical protein